jgi:hypothetical protein
MPHSLCQGQQAAGNAASEPENAAKQASHQQLCAARIECGVAAKHGQLQEGRRWCCTTSHVLQFCKARCNSLLVLLV